MDLNPISIFTSMSFLWVCSDTMIDFAKLYSCLCDITVGTRIHISIPAIWFLS